MISIDLGTIEYYDGNKNEFIYDIIGVVDFEYSLKVVYNWEAKWRKPFLKHVSNGDLTFFEIIDFYVMMASKPIDSRAITEEVMEVLSNYISETHTATTFTTYDEGQNGNNPFSKSKTYTSEELYALMFMNQIPIDFENRNLNRLTTVLRVISNYSNPPKKMSPEDIRRQNHELNKQRREQLKTKG